MPGQGSDAQGKERDKYSEPTGRAKAYAEAHTEKNVCVDHPLQYSTDTTGTVNTLDSQSDISRLRIAGQGGDPIFLGGRQRKNDILIRFMRERFTL